MLCLAHFDLPSYLCCRHCSVVSAALPALPPLLHPSPTLPCLPCAHHHASIQVVLYAVAAVVERRSVSRTHRQPRGRFFVLLTLGSLLRRKADLASTDRMVPVLVSLANGSWWPGIALAQSQVDAAILAKVAPDDAEGDYDAQYERVVVPFGDEDV